MSDYTHAPRVSRLARSLHEGPAAAKSAIEDLIVGRVLDDAQPSQSVEWITDLYASELTETERLCIRDAIVLLLEAWLQVEATDARPFLVPAVSLAIQVDLLVSTPIRTQTRLWTAVRGANNRDDAAVVIALLAEQGRLFDESHWTSLYQSFGAPVAASSTEGIRRRSGVGAALRWLYKHVDVATREDVMMALVARYALLEPDEMLNIIRSNPADVDGPLRADLFRLLSRYGIALPNGSPQPPHTSSGFPPYGPPLDIPGVAVSVGYEAYASLNSESIDIDDAIETWQHIEESAPPPAVLADLWSRQDKEGDE